MSKGPYVIVSPGKAEAKPVYAYKPTQLYDVTNPVDSAMTLTFVTKYTSLRRVVRDLHGNRNLNTTPLQLRIKHKTLYQGLRVSYTPLYDH